MNEFRHALVPTGMYLVVAAANAAAVVVNAPVAVPLSRSVAPMWPLACLTALPVATWLGEVGSRWLEGAAGRGPTVRLVSLAAAVALVAGSAGLGTATAAVAGVASPAAVEPVRNFAAVLGLMLVAQTTLSHDVVWAVGLLVVAGSWLLGSASPGVPPQRWALLLQPAGDGLALVVCSSLAAAGAVAYVVNARSWRSACSP